MPIGKNAINRVVNNGYSNVKTSAPDMENSVVEEKKSTPVKPAKNPVPKGVTSNKKSVSSKIKNPAPKAAIILEGMKKPTPKKTVAPSEIKEENKNETVAEVNTASEIIEVKEEEQPTPALKKSMESEPELAPVRTLEKVTEKSESSGEGYTNVGRALPYYLL